MKTLIEDYALIGDGETAALVSRDGSIDWLCWPRFDSDACFAALLGSPESGRWLIGLAEGAPPGHAAARRYRPDTLVMETDLVAPGGSARLIDFMPIREDAAALVRIVEGIEGTCRLRMDLRLRFDYGTISPWTCPTADGFAATVGPDRVVLRAPVPLRMLDHAAEAEFTVAAGQRLAFVLCYHNASQPVPPPLDAEAALGQTQAFWRDWIGRFDDARTRWPEAVRRSLITLKAMIYRPTGGLIAAPTTSLPEAPGGKKNWDYRYCWLRDSTFTLGALINAGYHEEARSWRDWLLRAIGGSPGKMQIMYRLDGGRHLEEWSIAGLSGYRYAHPVRIGNAAAMQTQVDVWGEVLDTLHLADLAGLPRSAHADRVRRELTEHLASIWDRPGAGLWESRGEPRHYTYSRVMAWVGIDRFLRLQDGAADDEMRRRMAALRDRIHQEVCHEGWNEGLGTFTQVLWRPRTRCERAAAAFGRLPASRRSPDVQHHRRNRAGLDGGWACPAHQAQRRRQPRGHFPGLLLLDGRLPEPTRQDRGGGGAVRARSGCPERSRAFVRGVQCPGAPAVGQLSAGPDPPCRGEHRLGFVGTGPATRGRVARGDLATDPGACCIPQRVNVQCRNQGAGAFARCKSGVMRGLARSERPRLAQ